jgi:hypothetical protein
MMRAMARLRHAVGVLAWAAVWTVGVPAGLIAVAGTPVPSHRPSTAELTWWLQDPLGIVLALAMLARGHGWSLAHGYRSHQVRPRWALAGWFVAAWQISLGFGVGLAFFYVLVLVCVVAGVGWLISG